MRRSLKKIKEILLSSPISVLNSEQLIEYYNYRVENLIKQKTVLVRRELEYLLCETGKGSLRFDPEQLSLIEKRPYIIVRGHNDQLYSEYLKIKKAIEAEIETLFKSDAVKNWFTHFINPYINELSIDLPHNGPLLIRGNYNNTPILIIIENGSWVMPDKKLMSLLEIARIEHRLPVVIARKIHGILFPFFKDISVIGCNLYTTFVEKIPSNLFDELKNKQKSEMFAFAPVEYCEKIDSIESFKENLASPFYDGYFLKNFFDNTLFQSADKLLKQFLRRKTQFDDFDESVKNIKSIKAKRGLIRWSENRSKLLLGVNEIVSSD